MDHESIIEDDPDDSSSDSGSEQRLVIDSPNKKLKVDPNEFTWTSTGIIGPIHPDNRIFQIGPNNDKLDFQWRVNEHGKKEKFYQYFAVTASHTVVNGNKDNERNGRWLRCVLDTKLKKDRAPTLHQAYLRGYVWWLFENDVKITGENSSGGVTGNFFC